LERLALKTYERLMKRDPDISFPQYSGKRVRYAEVAIEFENRKPVEILRMEYFIMHFDSKGRIDGTVRDDIMSLGVNRHHLFILKMILLSLMPNTTLLKNVLIINLDGSLLQK